MYSSFMAVIIERPQARPSSRDILGPEQGVIEEARRRQRQRRQRRTAIAVIVLLACGSVGATIFAGHSQTPHGTSRGAEARLASLHHRRERAWGGVRLSPALEGGEYGWCVTTGHGGTCSTVPQEMAPADVIGSEPRAREEALTVVLAPNVARVLTPGRRSHLVVLPGRQPYGLRVARLVVSRQGTASRKPRTSGGPPSPAPPVAAETVVALDAHGSVLARESLLGQLGASSESRTHWWQPPHPLPPGPCQINANGVAGLAGQWGHVAEAIHPYPSHIVGRAYFSCIDIEYYVHGWPLDAAVLVDAAHPGTPPAPIPGLRPVAGVWGVFNGPGYWKGDLTARRIRSAWLVVAGGSGLAQRMQVLRHLHASIHL